MDADATVKKATEKEMAERIAELEHRESQLKNLNDDMRRWLEAGEEEIVGLRSENATLQKQVKTMEKLMSDAEQNEAELCRIRASLAEENNLKRHREKEIQRLENECSLLTEQNKKLITERNRLNQQTEYDKTALHNLKTSLQNLQGDLEEAKLELQLKDSVILQFF
ncbi:protein KASH5-like [Thalassophryne amazonica]|uniref:protein KASH5-like n=1 Tax=Thalassophryne amazonica TaxID=390379 RepID=UPI00147222D5|nr:protein KASH5-like [Thalassophryne amazonica]